MFSTPLTCCSIRVATVSENHPGIGPGIVGRDLDGPGRDLRVLRDWKGGERNRAEDGDDNANHPGENGPIDEKVRKFMPARMTQSETKTRSSLIPEFIIGSFFRHRCDFSFRPEPIAAGSRSLSPVL